jgi:hypothetical protein
MNALPGCATLGRATTLIGSVTDQRTADLRVMADVDTASDLRDAAARLHAAVSQAEFNVEPPVDLTLVTAATAGLAAVDLDAYQRRIGDRVAGVAGRLDAGDTDTLPADANPGWHTDNPIKGIITDFCIEQRNGTFAIGFGTIRAGKAEPFTVYNLSGSGMRDLRGLIDRALGDRT